MVVAFPLCRKMFYRATQSAIEIAERQEDLDVI
jgi:hypothetical protein